MWDVCVCVCVCVWKEGGCVMWDQCCGLWDMGCAPAHVPTAQIRHPTRSDPCRPVPCIRPHISQPDRESLVRE